jgi:ADP-ribose pyrophosphatase YjhB (NUDIX family)
MKFCSVCGQTVSQIIPAGDNHLRHVCDGCGTIHYSNPNNVCGAILTHGSKILLCKRAIEPRYGMWTLPAGFMENGETVTEGAARETLEEANAFSHNLRLFGVFSLPHISQVYMMFKGALADGRHSPGSESLETELFAFDDIPWEQLAFPVIDYSLKLFVQQPEFSGVHTATALRHADRSVEWVQR